MISTASLGDMTIPQQGCEIVGTRKEEYVQKLIDGWVGGWVGWCFSFSSLFTSSSIDLLSHPLAMGGLAIELPHCGAPSLWRNLWNAILLHITL